MANKIIGVILSVIIILSALLFDTNTINNISELDGKYSIYINNKFYGTVSDRKPFDNYIKETKKKYNKESNIGKVYEPTNYTIDSITSTVDTNMSDEEILSTFKKKVEFLVEGYKVTITKDSEYVGSDNQDSGGEVTLTTSSKYATIYSTNKKEVDKAFDQIIKTFVDEKSIDRIVRGEEITELIVGTNETISYDVGGNVVGTSTKVPYTKVLTGDELYNKMLFYNTNEDKYYKVKDGDTIEKIASNNMLNVKELVAANKTINSENTILSPGQEIIVNLVDPVVTVESTNIMVVEEELPYETEIIEDNTMLSTKNVVKKVGSKGKVERVYEIDYLNGQTTSAGKIVGEHEIKAPVNRVVVKGTRQAPSYTAVYSSGIAGYKKSKVSSDGIAVSWVRPTIGGYMSSPYGHRWGRNHDGVDIAGLPTNSTIMAVADGLVVYSGYRGARGNMVIIDHLNGYVTYSQHLYSIDVKAGDTVMQGQRIGGMGTTGVSTGVHLHFEIFINGALVNPMNVYSWI
ncbi:MAG: peptidoglycan DD-metalloendopeptidase family protein [Bacilli bacterium]